jgi:hypothetical protein
MAKIPEYMVPSHFIRMKELPMTPNGKIDRKSLPDKLLDTDADGDEAGTAPETGLERELAKLWQEVLGRSKVGIHDNFFSIGGNSLLLVLLHSKIDKIYPAVTTVTDLFAYPTVSKLSRFISDRVCCKEGRRKENKFDETLFDMFDKIANGDLDVTTAIDKLNKI